MLEIRGWHNSPYKGWRPLDSQHGRDGRFRFVRLSSRQLYPGIDKSIRLSLNEYRVDSTERTLNETFEEDRSKLLYRLVFGRRILKHRQNEALGYETTIDWTETGITSTRVATI